MLVRLCVLVAATDAMRTGSPRVSGRRSVVAGAAAALALSSRRAGAASNGFVLAPPERGGLQSKWLENVRILLQDEADAVQYGGAEALAPGGPPPAVPALLLIPLVQVQATLRSFKPLLADASRWPMLQDVLSSGPFETREFKRIFNAYGDNIYYDSGSPEANAYLLGGATPSSSQTTQYLLRNEILKQIGELRDELKYQSGLAAEKRETDVADEALAAALAAFDEYLSLCPKKELEIAMSAVVPGTPQVARGGLERK